MSARIVLNGKQDRNENSDTDVFEEVLHIHICLMSNKWLKMMKNAFADSTTICLKN